MAAPVWLARTRAAFWTTCWPALKRDGESFGADKGDRKRLSTIIRTWVTNKALAVELRRGRDPSRARIRGSGPWSGDAAAEDSGFEVGVAVLDISMPDLNGLGVLSSLAGAGLETKVVFLTALATDNQIMVAIALGARGIMLKDAATDSLIDCIRNISQGKQWFPADLIESARAREASVPLGH